MKGASIGPWLKRLALAVVLITMVLAIYQMRHELVRLLAEADWRYVVAAGVVAFLYLPFNASVWGLVLRSLGADGALSRSQSAAIWIRCEAMRYLPGGIWGYASRVVEARRLGVGKSLAALSLTVELAITALAWGTVALTGLVISGVGLDLVEKWLPGTQVFWIVGGVLLGLLGIAVMWWRFGDKVRALFQGQLRPAIAARALFEYTALNFFFGLGFYLTFRGLAGEAAPGFFAATGVNAVAWFAGMLAIGVPAGLGVREGACYVMFQPFGLGETAAAAALLFRAVQMMVECLVLGATVALGRRLGGSEEPADISDPVTQVS